MEKGDWVVDKKDSPKNVIGYVTRVAKDGKWTDVKWSDGKKKWTKRVPTDSLKIVTTIPLSQN
jgi:hypothetical protein